MKTLTEKIYGNYEKLVEEGSYDLADKVESEKEKLGLVPVECCCCDRVKFLPRGETWYCGCGDE
ncbi:MAG: hypothetical protein WC453_05070 [Patescibacteria group bacterium]